jgi:Mechanosensitive ion channel
MNPMDFDTLFSRPFLATVVLVAIVVGAEITVRLTKRKTRSQFDTEKAAAGSSKELEQVTLRYNKRIQMLDIVRLAILFLALLLACMVYDIKAFSYILVALGALIIAMRESVNSLMSYFYILAHYDIGDDIRINNMLGEITRIRPINTTLVGKDDNGEYNGKLISIPNYSFLMTAVESQELKSDNYRRAVIQAIYNNTEFSQPFSVILQKIKLFLDHELPLRKLDQVGNYRSYSGSRYKLNYDYNAEGDVVIRIAFVTSPSHALERKEKIIAFIESLRSVTPHSKRSAKRN